MTTKPIQLIFKVNFEKLKEEVEIKVWCKDNYAITWMSNSDVLNKLVVSEKAKGSKISLGYDKDGKLMAIQKYDDLTGKQIAKKITKELKASVGGNLKTL